MKAVMYKTAGVEMKMVDIKGKLYCSTHQLMENFGVKDEEALKKAIQYRGRNRLSKVYLGDVIAANDLSDQDLIVLGIGRPDRNERLWTEDDLYDFAWIIDTYKADLMQENILDTLERKATYTCKK
jgi:hypothetical protein